jgi:hypothetical protein
MLVSGAGVLGEARRTPTFEDADRVAERGAVSPISSCSPAAARSKVNVRGQTVEQE